MGCCLGCFGIYTKRKPGKPPNRILPGDLGLTSTYVCIFISYLIRVKSLKRYRVSRSGRKVSFNINAQTHEPIPAEKTIAYQFSQSVEEEESEKNGAETGKGRVPYLTWNQQRELHWFTWMRTRPRIKCHFVLQQMENLKSLGIGNTRIRSQYLWSVLNPVENTTQWKEIKARAAPPPKHKRKKNIELKEEPLIPFSSKLRSNCSPYYNQSKTLLQDKAVDASLTNWLISPTTDLVVVCL
ncbi:uncharacterized protein LOC111298285 [Durio zibethinus]|uniref:Uncharacterized protein LOC111298285 n=1 Tax=Durio zibethinus TaxID=66656 RepID=A0A6P5Z7Q9_DURZI|nr:uncharacterized protein LOC111298285 [Durio zibethinus]